MNVISGFQITWEPSRSPEKLNHLIEEISGLIYSDGEMDSAEAEILNNIQQMKHQANLPKSLNTRITKKLQRYYQKLVTL